MKKEKAKANKNILLMAGTAASIVMVIVVLFFIRGSITGATVTEDTIKTNEKVPSQEFYTKQEIDTLVEKRLQEIINNKTLRIELSGNGNAYLCINSEGKIFRSEIPCK